MMLHSTLEVIKNKRKIVVSSFIILLLALLTVTWFRNDYLINGNDFDFSLSPTDEFFRNLYIWYDRSAPGRMEPRRFAKLFPYNFIMALGSLSGASLVTLQKVFFYFWWASAGVSMYFLASTLTKGEKKYVAGLVSAIFYMFNPYLMLYKFGGYQLSLFGYGFLPLMLLFFIKGLETKELKYGFLLSFFSLLTAPAGNNPVYVVVTWIVLLSYLIFYLILNLNKPRALVKGVKFVAVTLLFWSLLNLWWLLPLMAEGTIQAEQHQTINPLDVLLYQSSNTSFLNIFRVLGAEGFNIGFKGDLYVPYASVYQTPLFVLISFLLPIFVFAAMLLNLKNSKYTIYFTMLSVFGLFLVQGAHPPLGGIYLWLFEHFPYFWVFRMQYEKFGNIVVLGYAFLLGTTLSNIYLYIKSSKTRIFPENKKRMLSFTVVFFVVFLICGVYVFPFWTGDVIYPGGKVLPPGRVKIPDYYYDLSDWINGQINDFAIFSLPPSYRNAWVAFTWYSGADPTGHLVHKSIFQGGEFYDQVRARIIENSTLNIGKLLGLINVKYILLHGDSNINFYPSYKDSPEYLKSILLTKGDIHFERTFGDLYLFSNEYWKPTHIYATSNPILVQGHFNELIKITEMDDFQLGESVLFLFTQNDAHKLSSIDIKMIEFKPLNITLTVFDGRANPVEWASVATESYVVRYYAGQKGVISTNGSGDPDMLIFPSPDDCPYVFPPQSPDGWTVNNSTLVYLTTDEKPRKIYSIFTDDRLATDISVWWETGWMGMDTKPFTYPFVIPPHQRAIIKINYRANTVNLLIEPPYFEISSVINKPSIFYRKINPTKYIVHINAFEPYFLVFSESYHKDWIAYVDGQQISNEYHFMANGYANAWYINKTGTYNITLEFRPQKLFYVGSATSIITLIFCVLYIGKNKIKALYSRHVKKKL